MSSSSPANKDAPQSSPPIPYHQLSILGFILGFLGGFGIFTYSSLGQLIGFSAIFYNFELICRIILKQGHYEVVQDFLPHPSRFFAIAFLASFSLIETIFIQPLWLPRFIKYIMYCVGFVSFVSSQSFRIIQLLEGYLKEPTISLSFKSLRQSLRSIPLDHVSYYTCLLSLELATGNALSFFLVLIECMQKMDVHLRAPQGAGPPSQSLPPPKVERTYHGIGGLPIFDGLHSFQNVLMYSFCIGSVAGVGGSILLSDATYYAFGSYLLFLGIFHNLEYVSTAMYRDDVSLTAFLINHSTEYHAAVVCSVLEFWIEWLFFRSLKQVSLFFWIGILGTIISQIVRTLAMTTAQSNFTHLVSFEKEQNHRLVTWGIYRYLRHPSYTGFFYWGVFMQLTVANPICTAGYAYALHKFFTSRIQEEEAALVDFFGDEYTAYKKSAQVYIPGII